MGPGPLEAGAKWVLAAKPGARDGPGKGQGSGSDQGPHLSSRPSHPRNSSMPAGWLAADGPPRPHHGGQQLLQRGAGHPGLPQPAAGQAAARARNHPQGPDASAEGLNPAGLVAPRFQRKFKAKQVPGRVGGGNDQEGLPGQPRPSDLHRAFPWKCTPSPILLLPGS